MSENPYAAPNTSVTELERKRSDKPGVGARFLWAAGCALPIFIACVMLAGARGAWLMGLIGSVMFASFAGLIAMCIPVKPKVGFIIPAVLIALICAYELGTNAS